MYGKTTCDYKETMLGKQTVCPDIDFYIAHGSRLNVTKETQKSLDMKFLDFHSQAWLHIFKQ